MNQQRKYFIISKNNYHEPIYLFVRRGFHPTDLWSIIDPRPHGCSYKAEFISISTKKISIKLKNEIFGKVKFKKDFIHLPKNFFDLGCTN